MSPQAAAFKSSVLRTVLLGVLGSANARHLRVREPENWNNFNDVQDAADSMAAYEEVDSRGSEDGQDGQTDRSGDETDAEIEAEIGGHGVGITSPSSLLQRRRRQQSALITKSSRDLPRKDPSTTTTTAMKPVKLERRLPDSNSTAEKTEAAGSCSPRCTWQCDRPKCEQVCAPSCQAPHCETRCSEFDTSSCTRQCGKPICAIVCPKRKCVGRDCATCTTTCGAASCKMSCPGNQRCHNVCANPKCKWSCRQPSSCPKPRCHLSCETPRGCNVAVSLHEALPPLGDGEVVVTSFIAEGARAGRRNDAAAAATQAQAGDEVTVNSFFASTNGNDAAVATKSAA